MSDREASMTLTFPLPECKQQANEALNADKPLLVLYDIQQVIRNRLKYDRITEEQYAEWEVMRKVFWDACADRGVQIDMEDPYTVEVEDKK